MAINPSIALNVRGVELADPLAQYGRVAAIQSAQNQNALAQYQLATAQREQETTNALNAAYASAYDPKTGEIDANKLRSSLATGGFGSKLPTVEKSLLELGTARTAQQKAQTELVDAKLKQARQFLDTINPADPNAPQQFIAWHQANHADPVLGPVLAARGVTADSSMGRIQQAIAQGPAAFAELVNQSKLGTEKFMELNKPTITSQNLGGTVRLVQTPGLGGTTTVVPGSQAAVTMTPSEAVNAGLRAQEVGLRGREVNLREQESQLKREGIEGIAPKELQKRNADYPMATSAIKSIESKSDAFVKDLEALRDHPGLNEITGILAGRVGTALSSQGRAALALYNKVTAKGGFQALQDMRAASKTGGALGNVSNQEGKQLVSSFAAIDRTQDAPDVRAALDVAIGDVQGAKTRMREAYDSTYAYKNRAAAPAAPAANAAGGVDTNNPLLK